MVFHTLILPENERPHFIHCLGWDLTHVFRAVKSSISTRLQLELILSFRSPSCNGFFISRSFMGLHSKIASHKLILQFFPRHVLDGFWCNRALCPNSLSAIFEWQAYTKVNRENVFILCYTCLMATGNCKREILAIWLKIYLNTNPVKGLHLRAMIGREVDGPSIPDNSALQIPEVPSWGKVLTTENLLSESFKNKLITKQPAKCLLVFWDSWGRDSRHEKPVLCM